MGAGSICSTVGCKLCAVLGCSVKCLQKMSACDFFSAVVSLMAD